MTIREGKWEEKVGIDYLNLSTAELLSHLQFTSFQHVHSHHQTLQVLAVVSASQGSLWAASKHLLFPLKFPWKSPYKVGLSKSASACVILSPGSDCVQKQLSILCASAHI